MEASALPAPAANVRISISLALLRLRSDEQLVAMFRAGSDEAFRAIHERYRQRLLAYTRQMLGAHDAEDALQDVFLRAYRALRSSDREVLLRAWLYRIAHNRCVDELRRARPLPGELETDAEPAFAGPVRSDPPLEHERREEFRRLVADVRALPDQQRSALLMRELEGLSYEELARALETSVPAIKSLLLRARGGLVEAAVARATSCEQIRADLLMAQERGVRISGRARRHVRECERCRVYRRELRRLRRNLAALVPGGPLAHFGWLIGGGGGATGSIAAGGTGLALGGTAATKVAALVCCAALVTGAGGAALVTAGGVAPPGPVHHGEQQARVGRAAGAPLRPRLSARSVARVTGGALAPLPRAGHRAGGSGHRFARAGRRDNQPLTPPDGYDQIGVATLQPGTATAAPSPAAMPPKAAPGPAGVSLLDAIVGSGRPSGEPQRQQAPPSSQPASSGDGASGPPPASPPR